MKGAGCCAHGSAHKTCHNACTSAITTGNRTQAGGESYAVYVSLGRDGPADLPAIEVANGQGEQVKQLVSRKDWPDIFWMLSHTGKGQSRKDYADGCTGKASSFRVDHDQYPGKTERTAPTVPILMRQSGMPYLVAKSL